MAEPPVRLRTGGFATRPDRARDARLREKCRADALRRAALIDRIVPQRDRPAAARAAEGDARR